MPPSRMPLLSGIACVLVGLVLAGCASSIGTINAKTALPPGTLDQYTDVLVTVGCVKEVNLTDQDRMRIQGQITKSLSEATPPRFASVNKAQPGPKTLEATVTLTNYDEGSAFARAMLAGLGQIHVDGTVSLTNSETKAVLATYEAQKTFSWGGIYGAATSSKISSLPRGSTNPALIAQTVL